MSEPGMANVLHFRIWQRGNTLGRGDHPNFFATIAEDSPVLRICHKSLP
jgi:hypothetical protein